MKSPVFFATLVTGGLLVATDALAQDDLPKASIRVDVQMVSVSPSAALSLVPALSDEKTVEEANTRLQKMIANDEATLLGWPVLWLQNGITSDGSLGLSLSASPPKPAEKCRSETTTECRYPVEFNPPQVASIFSRPKSIRPAWGESIPTCFETRNTGPNLEAEAEVNAVGSTILLALGASFDRFLEFNRFRNQTSPLGIEGEMVQPRFLLSNARNRIHLRNGHLALLNVFVFSKPEPHVELFLVRAKATLLDPAKTTPAKK